jgi:hypothetical protein
MYTTSHTTGVLLTKMELDNARGAALTLLATIIGDTEAGTDASGAAGSGDVGSASALLTFICVLSKHSAHANLTINMQLYTHR